MKTDFLLTPSAQCLGWALLHCQEYYLKNANLVGEQLRYVVTFQGQWLALLGWSAACLHLKDREQWLKWSESQRRARLHLVAQNSRFVLLLDGAIGPTWPATP